MQLRAQHTLPSKEKAFVSLVRLADFYDFITDANNNIRTYLFESNVRDYQGDVEVNRGINSSLVNRDIDFWWLNNGITIIASDTSLSGDALTLTDAQIVNGLQTSRELFEVLSSQPVSDRAEDDRHILVRIIAPQSDDARERIITATNSQTKIPVASLRATDPIHRRIEIFFEANDFYYDRRKNSQRNRKKPRDKIVSIGYLAQSVMAIVLQRPDDSRARPSNLLKADPDYEQIFNELYPYEMYLRCVLIVRRIEAFLRSGLASYAANDKNNIRWHLAMFSVAVLLRRKRPPVDKIASFNVSLLTDEALEKSLRHVWEIYAELSTASANADQTAKARAFVTALTARIADINARRVPF